MKDAASVLELSKRNALPDPLRVLLGEFPRETWKNHKNYGDLIEFWLDRHLMFRRLLETLSQESEGVINGDEAVRQFAHRLGRYGGFFVEQLYVHHHMEDSKFFPVLSKHDIRIAQGFEILDADHHAIDHYLEDFVSCANQVLSARDDAYAMEQIKTLHDKIGSITTALDRHLTDEEELVVPILLKYGADGLE